VTGADEGVVPGPAGEDGFAVAAVEQVDAVVAVEHVVFTRPSYLTGAEVISAPPSPRPSSGLKRIGRSS
jgi:hypothetical protein